MPDIDFKAPLGPLPVWGWGAVVAVAALAAYAYTRKNAVTPPSSAPSGSNIDALGYQTAGIQGGSATVAPTVDSSSAPASNLSWISSTSRTVADQVGASPSAVYAALLKYTTGQSLSATEQGYVDKGISVGMAPPEGVQAISPVVPDPPKGTVVYFNDGANQYGGGHQYALETPGHFETTADPNVANAWARIWGNATQNVTYDQLNQMAAQSASTTPVTAGN